MIIRAAAIQFQHEPGNKAASLDEIVGFAAQAAEQGIRLTVFPEMCITGYWHVIGMPRVGIEALAEPVPEGSIAARLPEKPVSMAGGAIRCGARDDKPGFVDFPQIIRRSGPKGLV